MYRLFSNRRLLSLAIILIISNIIITGISLFVSYNKSVSTFKSTLVDIVERQKSLVTVLHEQGKSAPEIIQLLKKMREKFYDIGQTGEFVIACQSGDSADFLLTESKISKFYINNPERYGLPMCMALQGKSGYIFAKDYNGVKVLAAFTYMPAFQWGIVAKISVSELNRPYFEALYISLFITILLILFCIFLFVKISNPILKNIIDSEEHYRSLFNNKHVCMLVINPSNMKIADANPAACNFYGYKLKEMLSMDISQISMVQPDEIQQSLEKINKSQQYYFNVKHKLSDGTVRDVEVSAGTIRIKGKKFLYSIILDITKRKQIEEELIEAHELFQKTFQLSPVATGLAKLSGRIVVDVNNAFENLFGFTQTELAGKPITDFDIWENDEERQQAYQMLIKQGSLRDNEFSFKSRSGRIGRGILYAETIEQRGEKYILLKIIDITERKQAEEARREIDKRYRTLFEFSPYAITQSDMSGKILTCNLQAALMHGYERQTDLIGTSAFDLFSPDEMERAKINMQQTLKDGVIRNIEYRFRKKDGSQFQAELSATLITDAEGKPTSFMAITRDITERKQTEETLRKSEEKWQNLFNNSPDAIAIYEAIDDGKDFVFTDFNLTAEQTEKISRDQVVGKRISKAFPSAAELGFLETFRKVWLTGNTERMDITFYKDDRIAGWRENIIYKLRTGELVAIYNDVTERKKVEEALSESEERFSKAYMTSPIAFMIANMEDGRIIEVNDAFTNISGFSREEALASTTLNLKIWVHEEDRKHMIATLHNGQAVVRKEIMLCAKNGNVSTVLLSAQVIQLSHKYCIISSIEDITDRKLAEQNLKISEEKFRTFVDNVGEGFGFVNPEEVFVYTNPAAERIFGVSKDKLVGKNLKEFLSEKEYRTVLEQTQIRKKGKISVYENEIILSDGKKRNILITAVPQFDINKNFIGTYSIFRDINERKQAELLLKEKTEEIETQNEEYLQINEELNQTNEELKLAKEKAEESDSLKTAFLHNMSHEIRTPMNAIMGFSELLVKNYNDKSKLEKFSSIINQRCKHLLEIINDILDIAKIESGQLPINREECNLNDLFTELTSFFNEHQKNIGKQNIMFSLQAQCNPRENTIITDTIKLKQIFINLIYNAFKFTNAGKIEGGCKYDADHNLYFYVSDTGIGIPPDKYEVIFERFSQLQHEKGGTGLGLSIVKGLVSLLGGKIWLESELEDLPSGKAGGTTFYFSLPYEIAQSVHREQVSIEETQEYHFSGKTILIVEDDLYNVDYIKEILSDTGLNIIHTEYGKKAIKIATTQLLDLVLIDIRLPDIEGYEVVRQIKKRKPGLKFIAQTAYAAHEDRQKAFDTGCIDYISKPLNRNLLLSMINKYLLKGN